MSKDTQCNFLLLRRDGEELEIPVITIQKEEVEETILAEEEEEGFVKSELLGIEVRDITPDLEKEYRLLEGEEGVVITSVETGGPTDIAGMSAGNVIKKSMVS